MFSQEETFGPIVGIMKVWLLYVPCWLIKALRPNVQVTSDSEAVELMNDSPYGLTASIWTGTQSHSVFTRLASEIDTGTVFLNKYNLPLPFLAVWLIHLVNIGVTRLTRPLRGPVLKTVVVVSAAANSVSKSTFKVKEFSTDAVFTRLRSVDKAKIYIHQGLIIGSCFATHSIKPDVGRIEWR